jgi:TrmH family RNA methyltransferase
MHALITSIQNPKIRSLVALDKARERRKQQLFTIEGIKELDLALKAGYQIGNLFFCEDLVSLQDVNQFGVEEKNLIPVSRAVFEKLAVREGSGGVLAVAVMRRHRLDHLDLPTNPLILVLESVEKPGNLGAILRTADAAGVHAVICCDPQTDIYNPNVIRSSIGCVFTTPLAITGSAEAIAWLKNRGIKIFATSLQASVPYHLVDYRTSCAIVMGTEATGLSDEWISNSTQNIIIPMHGKIDSMNVSTATAVVVFEAVRQRIVL